MDTQSYTVLGSQLVSDPVRISPLRKLLTETLRAVEIMKHHSRSVDEKLTGNNCEIFLGTSSH